MIQGWTVEDAEGLLRTPSAEWRNLELRSQSRIADIERCPMRARLRYSPDRRSSVVGEIAGRAADCGTACHEMLLAPMEGREPSPDGFDPEVWAEAAGLCEDAAPWVGGRLLPRERTYSIECSGLSPEFALTKDYGDGRPPRHNFIVPVSERYAICGAWDQCGYDAEQYCRIKDIKSGRIRVKPDLQGQWYCYSAWANYPAHPAYIFELVFLRHRHWEDMIGFAAEDMGELRRLIVERIERADALLVEARPRWNEYCGSCPLKSGCVVANDQLQTKELAAPALQAPTDWQASDTYDQGLKWLVGLAEAERARVKAWRLEQIAGGQVLVDGLTPVLRSRVGTWEIPIEGALPIVREAGIPGEEVFVCKSKTALEALGRKHPEWKEAIKAICKLKQAKSYKEEIDWVAPSGAVVELPGPMEPKRLTE